MQNFRDYYEILGIAKEATADEIKRAYRALARQYHPDLNPGDQAAEEKFKLLGEAYDVLSDADKRSQYEAYSRYWNQKGFWGRRSKSNGRVSKAEAEYSAFEDFDNFVEQLLKRHQNSDSPPWQSPAETVPSGREVASSATQTQAANRSTARPDTARRSRPDAAPRRSPQSAAKRYKTQGVAPSRRDAEADLTVPLEKAYAGGLERVRLEDGRSLEVNMPPGMVTGQRIRLKGQGIEGGNLYLRIEVEPHAYFTLREGDVYCRLPISPSEAVLGDTLAVPTLGGLVNVMVPPGVQSGQRLRLTGKGYPIGPGLYGDQIVEIDLVVPTVLDDEEKALYQELKNIERFDPRANLPL
ncbi:MAG: J domain-containing protein [Phormidesmis sp. RL_2_1]|nr:J domain-containing protein [Phormidesmis sp. RL_2_1]